MEKKQRIVVTAALILGIMIMIVGVVMLAGDRSHTGYNGGLSRASTSMEFGADFYTEEYQATSLAANAITDLYDVIRDCFGWLFIFLGGIDICALAAKNDFGEVVDAIKKRAAKTPDAAASESESGSPDGTAAELSPDEIPEEPKENL
jgi:hypothetical protein